MQKRPLIVVGAVIAAVAGASFLALGFGLFEENLEWRWSDEQADIHFSIREHLPDYEVEFVLEKEFYTPINIRERINQRLVYSIQEGHKEIVFTRWQDTLYVAEHRPIASGCGVVAFDLKTGNQIWKSSLYGIGSTMHSKYRNRVNIKTDGRRIIIYGKESHGRYVEHLDIATGAMLANKRFDAAPETFLERIKRLLGFG